jgi:NAD(P)-dependent dehydrogenase (short-subunit alcohol dehydrogenase family)
MLGEAGATVYCTGRSIRGSPATPGRSETIEETAEMVDRYGGRGIAARVDHRLEGEVRDLVERIAREQGRLDVLVNDLFGAPVDEWKPFWQLSISKGLGMLENALHSHLITSRHAVPVMLEAKRGLIVEIADGDFTGYREQLFFDLANFSKYRIAYAMALELRKHGIAALSLTPGYTRTEAVLARWGVTEENWREGAEKDPNFIASESPFYVGRAVAALAADPDILDKSGRVFTSAGMASEYGFTDMDGRQPDFDKYLRDAGHPYWTGKRFDEAFFAYWTGFSDLASNR